MPSPYAPYASLTDLAAAAGVPLEELSQHTTAALKRLAAARAGERTRLKLGPPRRGTQVQNPRSVRFAIGLEEAAIAVATREGKTLNRLINELLLEYVEHQELRDGQ